MYSWWELREIVGGGEVCVLFGYRFITYMDVYKDVYIYMGVVVLHIQVMGHVMKHMRIGGEWWCDVDGTPSPLGGGGNSVAALTSPWHASHYCPPLTSQRGVMG